MFNNKKVKNNGYQPLQNGYRPSQIIGKIKPPKGGTGETQTPQGEPEREDKMCVKITGGVSGYSIDSSSAESILLFKILEKLEEIRCGIIDVESQLGIR
jgi:hypothetical protein